MASRPASPGTLDVAVEALLLDRALGIVLLASYPKKRIDAATALLGLQKLAPHFQYGFTVRNLTPPTIGGTPQPGLTLTVDPGRWAGAPSAFASYERREVTRPATQRLSRSTAA